MSVYGNFQVLEKDRAEVIGHFQAKPYIGSLAVYIGDLWWRCAILTRELLRPFTN
jgi:hypothetical protein